MRNLLALVGLAVVVFLGLGWYLGWYSFVISPGSEGRQRIQVDLDTHKIAEDAQRAKEKVGKVLAADPNAATAPTAATPPTQAGNDLVGPPTPSGFLRSGSQPTGRR